MLKKPTKIKPFIGDGRRMVQPIDPPKGTTPISVNNYTGRKLFEMFMLKGVSYHSFMGSTIWAIVAACKANNVKYKLNHAPGCGFSIEKVI